jgi:hypothetical protein
MRFGSHIMLYISVMCIYNITIPCALMLPWMIRIPSALTKWVKAGQIKPWLNSPEGVHGGIVVKELRYKPAGRGFDSRLCHWNFSLT